MPSSYFLLPFVVAAHVKPRAPPRGAVRSTLTQEWRRSAANVDTAAPCIDRRCIISGMRLSAALITRALLAAAAASIGCRAPESRSTDSSASLADTGGARSTYHREDVAKVVADLRLIDTTRGIDELRAIDVGGIKQWISVRGRDRRNPILLFVHGGPGSPMMPAGWVFQTPWEEFFTVVQWDQRGAGKTAASNDPAQVRPTITIDRMVTDGEEVIEYLRRTYRKEKIFLMGHSWGTFIGLEIAQRHPEWLHAYLGMGQAVYGLDNERIGYEWALRAARAENNQTAVAELEQLAPYPNADGTVPVEKILVQRKWVIHYGGLTWGRSTYDYEQNAARFSPEYTSADFAALASNDLTALRQLLGPPNVLDYREVTTFRCPVFLFAGRYDYETVSEVAREWFDRIRAPRKSFFWFEHSAHMIPFEEPGKLLLHLVRDVRPLAEAAGDAPKVGE
jgi:pimeloyl-ACP methyl ester carboxylesterase